MTPSHVATLAALSSVVAALKKSKANACKTILKDLGKDHGSRLAMSTAYTEAEVAGGTLGATDLVRCMHAMDITWEQVLAGAEPCIVDGRYAVRTEGALKLGPKVVS